MVRARRLSAAEARTNRDQCWNGELMPEIFGSKPPGSISAR